jgi:hypothetical protein
MVVRKRKAYQRLDREELRRRKQIRGVMQKGKRGRPYCQLLDNEGIKPPRKWLEEGCPDTYGEAYKSSKWRKRIQDEKSRLAHSKRASLSQRDFSATLPNPAGPTVYPP